MEGVGEDPTIFTARSLPSDPRLFATVTNTYLGTRVYHDILHVSGTYNGAQGYTHRAVLPSPLNVQLEASDTAEQLTQTFALDTNTGTTTALLSLTKRAPQLRHPGTCGLGRGMLRTHASPLHRAPEGAQGWGPQMRLTAGLSSQGCPVASPGSFLHTLEGPRFRASQRIYAHRTLPHVLAFSVAITRLAEDKLPITVLLRAPFTPESPDLDLRPGPDFQGAR